MSKAQRATFALVAEFDSMCEFGTFSQQYKLKKIRIDVFGQVHDFVSVQQ